VRAALALVALAVAGCGGSAETVTVDVTTTVEETTTVVETVTGETEAPAEEPALDPDDVESPLDVRDVLAVREGDLLTVTVVTYEPWESSLLGARSVVEPGTERITVLYDIDNDGTADYRGAIVLNEGFPGLSISGSGQAFETVTVERPDSRTASMTHPVDVFYLGAGGDDLDPNQDMQVAVRTAVEGEIDRAPDAPQWVGVPFNP
jgi:hypothetical protein